MATNEHVLNNVEKAKAAIAKARGLPSPEEVEAMTDAEVEALVLRVTGWEWVEDTFSFLGPDSFSFLGPNCELGGAWVVQRGARFSYHPLGQSEPAMIGDMAVNFTRGGACRQVLHALRQNPEHMFDKAPASARDADAYFGRELKVCSEPKWSVPGEVPDEDGIYAMALPPYDCPFVVTLRGSLFRPEGSENCFTEMKEGSAARFLYLSPLPKPPEASDA